MHTIDLLALQASKIGTKSDKSGATACTALRYMPTSSQGSSILLAAVGSYIFHIHVSTAKLFSQLEEHDNKVYNIAVQSDGLSFASCGSDHILRLYDSHTCKLVSTLDHGDGDKTAGHSNQIFGLAWNAEDPNTLVSGGWDHTVQVWDIRLQRSVRSIYGPYICGDSLDIKGGRILTGSWRHTDPLELWDLGTCKLLTRLPFHQPEQDACKLYAAKFVPGGNAGSHIIAGGSGKMPCVKLFKNCGELVGTLLTSSAVNSLDFLSLANRDSTLAVCCKQDLQILSLNN